jgi:N-ethylmaleimide reductase
MIQHEQGNGPQPLLQPARPVSRFALGGELAASDPGTHYRGGARGYTDYPVWAPSEAPR